MSKLTFHTHTKYLETGIEERYQDTAKILYDAKKRQESLRDPGDIQLGPYLTVSNAKKRAEVKESSVESAICIIL